VIAAGLNNLPGEALGNLNGLGDAAALRHQTRNVRACGQVSPLFQGLDEHADRRLFDLRQMFLPPHHFPPLSRIVSDIARPCAFGCAFVRTEGKNYGREIEGPPGAVLGGPIDPSAQPEVPRAIPRRADPAAPGEPKQARWAPKSLARLVSVLVSVVVSVRVGFRGARLRSAARKQSRETRVNTGDLRLAAGYCGRLPTGLVGSHSPMLCR